MKRELDSLTTHLDLLNLPDFEASVSSQQLHNKDMDVDSAIKAVIGMFDFNIKSPPASATASAGVSGAAFAGTKPTCYLTFWSSHPWSLGYCVHQYYARCCLAFYQHHVSASIKLWKLAHDLESLEARVFFFPCASNAGLCLFAFQTSIVIYFYCSTTAK